MSRLSGSCICPVVTNENKKKRAEEKLATIEKTIDARRQIKMKSLVKTCDRMLETNCPLFVSNYPFFHDLCSFFPRFDR